MSAPESPDPEYSIETKDLSLWYGDFQALENVGVRIRKGIITSLIGPNHFPSLGPPTITSRPSAVITRRNFDSGWFPTLSMITSYFSGPSVKSVCV